jgi:hypothetical protein
MTEFNVSLFCEMDLAKSGLFLPIRVAAIKIITPLSMAAQSHCFLLPQ